MFLAHFMTNDFTHDFTHDTRLLTHDTRHIGTLFEISSVRRTLANHSLDKSGRKRARILYKLR